MAKAAKQAGLLDPWEGEEARSLSAELGVDLGIERIELNTQTHKVDQTHKHKQTAKDKRVELEPAYAAEGGKIIGAYWIDPETQHKWLIKGVRSQKHFLRNPPAIAYDKWTIQEAQRKGVALLEVRDGDTGKIYQCHLTQFIAGCLEIDRGHGVQLALPLGKWNKEEKKENVQPALLSE